MSDQLEMQAYGFVLTPGDHLKLVMADRETLLRWDDVKGFVGVASIGVICSYHLYLTPEACKKGAEIARRNGLDPIIMDEPLTVNEDMIKKFMEAAERDD